MAAVGDGDSPLVITTTTSTTSSSSTTQQEPSIGDPPPPLPAPTPVRPVILETAKEAYLLSPSVLTVQGRVVRVYDIALVLETEVVVEDQEDQAPPVEKVDVETKVVDEEALSLKTKDALIATTKDGSAPSVSNIADGASEPKPKSGSSSSLVPLPSPPAIDDAGVVESPAPAPLSSSPPSEDQNPDADSSLVNPNKPTLSSPNNTTTTTMLIDDEMMLIEENNVKPQFAAVQVLQRGLSVEMFRFAEDGVYVLDGTAVSASASANDGMETEWAISVRNWKWAPRGPSLRERV